MTAKNEESASSPSLPAPAASSGRGFASMDLKRRLEVSSRGGRTAQRQGKAHKFTSEEAQQAGRKGGATISQDREHMAAIGKRGGTRKLPLADDPKSDSTESAAHNTGIQISS